MERYYENINRYAELFTKRGDRFWIEGNNIYRLYQKMLVRDGAIKKEQLIDSVKGKKLLSKSKGILFRQTFNFDCNSSQSLWYAVICDKFTSVEDLKSKQRNEINRGLQNCQVKKISASDLANEAYNCYYEAFENYKNASAKPYSEDKFKENILNAEGFDDIVHYWGVYSENRMIAFATNYVYGNTEVAYNSIKIHPEFLGNYPMYALIYRMNEFYLKEQQFEYVNDGFCSLLHETGVQNFLIKKFGFRKVYLKLDIQYRPFIGFLIKLAFPFRNFIAKFDARFKALFELERIHRRSKK